MAGEEPQQESVWITTSERPGFGPPEAPPHRGADPETGLALIDMKENQ
jgi:hypothetical protein